MYHNEKHWLHNGGRIAGEVDYPSSDTLVSRALQLLIFIREDCVTISLNNAQFKGSCEWSFFEYDDDEDEEVDENEKETAGSVPAEHVFEKGAEVDQKRMRLE